MNKLLSTLSLPQTVRLSVSNLTWLTKSLGPWTLRKGPLCAQCQPIPVWFSNKIFQRLTLTISYTTSSSSEISNHSSRSREAISPMQLTKSPAYASTTVACTSLSSNNLLDNSAEPAKTGWFWIQTMPSPSKCMMMQTSVGTGTGQKLAMTPWPQNHNQGTYYYMQNSLLYGLLNYRRSFPYILQSPSMFFYHINWDIWLRLWD